MKNNKRIKTFLFALILSICMFMAFTNFYSNIWGLLTSNGFFIPAESNVFKFKVLKVNEGSGDWWLYGEDGKYYYGLNIETEDQPKYFKMLKGQQNEGFDPYNYKTWTSYEEK